MIGKWINGKTLYRKVVQLTNLPNNSTASTPHGITNIDYVVQLNATMADGSYWKPLPYTLPPTGGTPDINLYMDSNSINVKSSGSYTGKTAYAIVTYTKTA